jgi:opacity protein-like surface antigen
MNRKLSVLLFITGIFVASLSAKELKLGFFAGANDFRTAPQEYYGPPWFYSHYPDTNHLGHYYLDESGKTFQVGLQLLIGDHFGIHMQYRTPREGNSYTYSTEHPGYPSDDNPPRVTVVKSHLSAVCTEARYYVWPDKDLSFYTGIGVELAFVNVDIHEVNSTTYVYPWISIPDKYFTRLGTKLLGGLILPAGVMINLSEHVSIDLGINYTFMRINQWDRVTVVPVDQNMSGLYLKIGIGYNL